MDIYVIILSSKLLFKLLTKFYYFYARNKPFKRETTNYSDIYTNEFLNRHYNFYFRLKSNFHIQNDRRLTIHLF